jgi:hypothetical protein
VTRTRARTASTRASAAASPPSRADLALYRAKAEGRDGWRVAPPASEAGEIVRSGRRDPHADLDPRRRAGLFDALDALPGQVWMTGADPVLFGELGRDGWRVAPPASEAGEIVRSGRRDPHAAISHGDEVSARCSARSNGSPSVIAATPKLAVTAASAGTRA